MIGMNVTKKPDTPAIRMVLIGCGGIGTWLAPGLAKGLQFQRPMSALLLIDGDVFEEKNAERQNFISQGNKAVALRRDLQPHNPSIFIVSKAAWIVSEEAAARYDASQDEQDDVVGHVTAESILIENDIVYCVVDNHPARLLVLNAAQKLDNVDVFIGGNGTVEDGDPLEGSIYHYQRRDGEDVTLHPAVMHPEIADPKQKNPGEMSCQERSELEGGSQLLAINMEVAAQLLMKTSQVVYGDANQKQEAMQKAEIYFDGVAGGVATYDRRPSPVTVSV
jgi:hypothetical protein